MNDINKKIEQSTQKLESIKDETSKEYAKELETLGLYYYKSNDINESMAILEKSLEINPTITDGYKTLMGIYNTKRAEAANEGNINEINNWLNKMDKMRNIAKKGTINRR